MKTTLLMIRTLLLIILVWSNPFLKAQSNETEPNNSLNSANYLKQDSIKNGQVNTSGDPDDHFKIKIARNSTVKFIISATNTGSSTNYLYLSFYDGRKSSGNFYNRYLNNNSSIPVNGSATDTIIFHGRGVDSMYIKLNTGGKFNYNIKYILGDFYKDDAEPNNDFPNSVYIPLNVTDSGMLNYTAMGVNDSYDMYKTFLPFDGTLRLILEGTNKLGSNGYLLLESYDGRKATGNIYNKYLVNNSSLPPNSRSIDTIYYYGRGSDSFYFKLSSNGAFQYNLRMELLDTSVIDNESNDNFDLAIFNNPEQTYAGHIGYYKAGTTDQNDYYKTVIPRNGTLNFIVQATNLNGSNGNVYMMLYDARRASGNFYNRYLSNNSSQGPGVTFYDTFRIYGMQSDTLFFKFSSSGAFKYRFRYFVTDTVQSDKEPNSTFANAVYMKEAETKYGNVTYYSRGTVDANDMYKTFLNKDGTLRIIVKGTNLGNSNGYLYMSLYDSRKTNGNFYNRYLSNNSSQLPHTTQIDTFYLMSMGRDSFYISFNSNHSYEYSISYDILDTSENDIEPNTGFANAVLLREKQIIKGHVGYKSGGTIDQEDYYRVNINRYGTLRVMIKGKNNSGITNYLYFSFYDGRKENGNFYNKYLGNNSSLLNNSTTYDTILFHGRAIDSFFFKLNTSVGFQYEISYDIIDSAKRDPEPNDNFATAVKLKLKEELRGNTRYAAGGTSDAQDYISIGVPANGTIRVIGEYTNRSGSTNWQYMEFYDKRKVNGYFLSRYIANTSTVLIGQTIKDTFNINCYKDDSLFIRISSYDAFEYKIKFEFIDRMPKANLEFEQLGNTVGFRPYLSNATGFEWDLGDGTKTQQQFPLKTYKPGGYPVKLIVTNSVCNFKDTATAIIKVKGIEYYTPDNGGAGGDVSVQIYGGALSAETVVKLVKGSTVLTPVDKYTNSLSNRLTAVFDLHFAQEGTYDVMIQLPGDTVTTYKNGFKIDKLKYPYTYSQIQGPSRMRNNTDNMFSLVVGNTGNVAASGVVVAVVWPQGITISYKNKFIKKPRTGIDTVIVPGDPHIYTLPFSDLSFLDDSLNTVTAIDSFEGKPYKGYIRYLLIPHIPANGTVEFPFIARATSSMLSTFYTFTLKPNQWGSCPTGNWMDYNEDITAELLDMEDMIIDKTNMPLLKALSKTAKIGQKHAGSMASYAGKHFWAWWDGYEVDEDQAMLDWLRETEANNAFAIQTAVDELGSFAFSKGIGKLNDTYQKQVDFINKTLANNKTLSPKMADAYVNILNRLSADNKRLNKLKEIFDDTKNLNSLNDKLQKIQELTDDCSELKKQLEDLLKNANKELDHQDVKDKPIQTANSFDPNEINGPIGTKTERYIGRDQLLHYVISFENVDTASAAAQIVYISDTLDKKVYDLNSFEFADFSIGNRSYRVPKGRKELVMEVLLGNGIKARLNASIDLNTGIVNWQMTAIDTLTGDIPVFEGFLPPNINKPEGEGSVSFTVATKDNIADGAVISNFAKIVFDQNEPIHTNIWVNTIDTLAPSSLCKAVRKNNSTNIIITFNGNDNTSGINYYDLYVSIDGGPWISMGGTGKDTLELIADFEHIYSFCSFARDNVGNLESKPFSAESTLGVNTQYLQNKLLYTYPNPTDGIVLIKGEIPEDCHYSIMNINGQVIESGELSGNQISLENLNAGFYIIRLSDGNESVCFKVMKI